MRHFRPAFPAIFVLLALSGCKGRSQGPTESERALLLASAIASSNVTAPPERKTESIGHAANVLPGVGPKRLVHDQPAPPGVRYPILAGEGVGPIRFGATKATIERLMAAPCEESTEKLCRYVTRGVTFELEGGAVSVIRVSRKGRAAITTPDGSIREYGFFPGNIPPDLYFGMLPAAVQAAIGAPQKVEPVSPMGADGFSERHVYDGMTLEYDRWSNGNLVLGAAILTKSATAAAANKVAEEARYKQALAAKEAAPKSKPRPSQKQEPPR
jgi:hypothetical protein